MALIRLNSYSIPAQNLADGDYTVRYWYNYGFIDSAGQPVQSGTATTGMQLRGAASVSGGFLTSEDVQIYTTVDAQSPFPQSITLSCQVFKGNSALPIYPFQQSGCPSSWIIYNPYPDDFWELNSLTFLQQASSPAYQQEWMVTNQEMIAYVNSLAFASASASVEGITFLDVDPDVGQPSVAVGVNSPLLSGSGFYFLTNYADLATAVSEIDTSRATLLIKEIAEVDDDLTVPENITLFFTNAGGVQPATGKTITILGSIVAAPIPIFYNALAGEGSISLVGNEIAESIEASWWDGGDFGKKVTAVVTALPATGGVINAEHLTSTQVLSADLTINKPYVMLKMGIMTLSMGAFRILVAQGIPNVSLIGYGPWGYGDGAGSVSSTRLNYSGTGAAITVGGTGAITYSPAIHDIAVDCSDNTAGSAYRLHNTLFADVRRVWAQAGVSGQSGTGVGLALLGTNSSTIYSGLNTVQGYRLYNFQTGLKLSGPNSSVNGNYIRDGNIAALSHLVAGARGIDLDGAESTTLLGCDVEGYSEGLKITHDYNCLFGLRMENIGAAIDTPPGYSIEFGVGAEANYVQAQPVFNALETIIDLNVLGTNNRVEYSAAAIGPKVFIGSNGSPYSTPTNLYSGYFSQNNPIVEIGDDTSLATNVPFSVLALSVKKTAANLGLGVLAFVNRNVADGLMKILAMVQGSTDSANNSGRLQFFTTTTGGTLTERARITDIGIWNTFKGGDVTSAATIVPTGNSFKVTGTVNIDNIDTTNIQEGTEITMIFTGALTVNDGAGNLKLAGNFTTSADDTLTVVLVSGAWYEKCRSAN